MIPVLANQATALKRRMYFQVVQTDGITAATGEAGGQPQISTNGAAFTNTGIGTLTHVGNGLYSADVTQAAVATAGDTINGRYKSASTAEIPCRELFRVVAYDPDDAAALGLSRVDAAVTSRASQTSLDTVDDFVDTEVAAILAAVDTEVAAIKLKTDQLAFTNAGKVDAAVLAAGDFAQAAADKSWSTGARTLTAFGFQVDVSAAGVLAIWAAASRTITAGVTLTAGGIQAVWDALVSAFTTPGSIGKLLADNVAAAATDPLGQIVPGAYTSGTAGAVLGRLASGQVRQVSPLSADGLEMTVRRGDDYAAADARAFVWIDEANQWVDPILSATWTARTGWGVVVLTKACTVLVATGAGKSVEVEFTAAETAAFKVGSPVYRFDVELLSTAARKDTPIGGRVFVLEDQTHA